MFRLTLLVCLMTDITKGVLQLEEAKNHLKIFNEKYTNEWFEYVSAGWAYTTNMNDITKSEYVAASRKYDKFKKSIWEEIKTIYWQQIQDPDVLRQFKMYSNIAEAALPDDKLSQLAETTDKMRSIFIARKAELCEYKNDKNCNIDVTVFMRKSNDAEELAYYFKNVLKVGEKLRPYYPTFVSLYNEAAKLNGFETGAEMLLRNYENPNMDQEFEKLYEQILPLYEQLFTYVRRKLREQFGEKLISKKGPIPLHLLREVYGISWSLIADLSMPYPDIKPINITNVLKEKNYDAKKMFERAHDFFTSMSFQPVNEGFWKNSIIEKPPNPNFDCQPTVWDFRKNEDYRIKTCTQVSEDFFYLIHHKMAHIMQIKEYKDQPSCYAMGAMGANEGFEDGISDMITLSVRSQTHLHKIGILPKIDDREEADINFLFDLALKKVVFLPYGFAAELWRWNVFRNKIAKENYNCEFWNIAQKYRGIKPADVRNETQFDIGAANLMPINRKFMSYFVASLLQFQFFQALCKKAKQFDPEDADGEPLHHCDIYQNEEAGALLKEVMKLGRSKQWPITLEHFTGNRNIDAGAILKYFAPLYKWLKKDNEEHKEFVGWEITETVCQ